MYKIYEMIHYIINLLIYLGPHSFIKYTLLNNIYILHVSDIYNRKFHITDHLYANDSLIYSSIKEHDVTNNKHY